MTSSAAQRAPERDDYSPPPFEPLPRASLRGIERLSVPIGEAINTWPRLKSVADAFGYHVPRNYVTWAAHRRWQLHGLENLETLRPKRGVILVSNHRSVFDVYVAASVVVRHGCFIERV